MKEIKHIVGFIAEETADAHKYINYAVKVKSVDEYAYQTLLDIAQQEIKHIDMLHTVAVKMIEAKQAKMKAEGREIPPYMQDMWNEEHTEMIEKVAKLKYALEIAKK